MKKYFFLLAILAVVSCRKDPDSRKFLLTGKFVDDITSEPVAGSGTISVDGNTWGNDVWFSTSFEEGIGNGIINNEGSFSASFKPKNFDHYMFWIRESNKKDYWYPDLTIERSEFIGGTKDTTIRLPRFAILNINFHNATPFDKNDRIIIHAYPTNSSLPFNYDYQWESLQNCEVKDFMVYGGANAQGNLRAIVASGRIAEIYWDVRKNGIEKSYKDTVFCPRNIAVTYRINY